MLVLTRLKGQSVTVRHSGAELTLRYKRSTNGTAEYEIYGDVEAFELRGFINFNINPISAIISQDTHLVISRGGQFLRVGVNYIRPERGSFFFDAPMSFHLRRDDLD